MYSHSFLPVPYFLAGNAGPGLCLQWKEIFCDGHISIFMAWLSTQEEYLHPSNNTGEPASPITSSPPSLPDKGVLIMEKINWNKICSTKVKLRKPSPSPEPDYHMAFTWPSSNLLLTCWVDQPISDPISEVYIAHDASSSNTVTSTFFSGDDATQQTQRNSEQIRYLRDWQYQHLEL